MALLWPASTGRNAALMDDTAARDDGAALDVYFGTGSAASASSDVPIVPEWPAYCNPRYVMPATIQVNIICPR